MHHPQEHHEKKGGKFFDGFFWGAAIGGGFAYLISTKKGRDLLKGLAQDGMDALENMANPEPEKFEEMPIVEEQVVMQEVLVGATPSPAAAVEEPQQAYEPQVQPQAEVKESKKTRFFKKSPKK